VAIKGQKQAYTVTSFYKDGMPDKFQHYKIAIILSVPNSNNIDTCFTVVKLLILRTTLCS
jgi:hypothetical protein